MGIIGEYFFQTTNDLLAKYLLQKSKTTAGLNYKFVHRTSIIDGNAFQSEQVRMEIIVTKVHSYAANVASLLCQLYIAW